MVCQIRRIGRVAALVVDNGDFAFRAGSVENCLYKVFAVIAIQPGRADNEIRLEND
jgi:hypothetical protein